MSLARRLERPGHGQRGRHDRLLGDGKRQADQEHRGPSRRCDLPAIPPRRAAGFRRPRSHGQTLGRRRQADSPVRALRRTGHESGRHARRRPDRRRRLVGRGPPGCRLPMGRSFAGWPRTRPRWKCFCSSGRPKRRPPVPLRNKRPARPTRREKLFNEKRRARRGPPPSAAAAAPRPPRALPRKRPRLRRRRNSGHISDGESRYFREREIGTLIRPISRPVLPRTTSPGSCLTARRMIRAIDFQGTTVIVEQPSGSRVTRTA